MMMKNNLMDNLSTDYGRTAVAKRLDSSRGFPACFRNSFIPIASSLGQLITIIVSGSILIELVFDIQGFGQLQYRALLGPDQMLIMGHADGGFSHGNGEHSFRYHCRIDHPD